MPPPAGAFVVRSSLRVPGLGLLLLPASPVPGWLAAPDLHTAVQVRLHSPGQPALLLPATIEELGHDGQPPTRALLLDADPGTPPAGAWLVLVQVVPSELF
ncbi:hypothetical protein [Hymenobacter cheonanensis]|uniref:hypothetical protein n=1 Tax=Hymenobacter sp. CA2-7 TaxID=3063993 RepID=UPI0027123479|nr:hypothetical protein [Hymenobacter sp. CA2-7]MDO7884777.1 hypothetical protein [Hymenobacter sp. CA2-7]